MKLTKSKLKQLVKEELQSVLNETNPQATALDHSDAIGSIFEPEERFHKYEEAKFNTLGNKAIQEWKQGTDVKDYSSAFQMLKRAAKNNADAKAILDAVTAAIKKLKSKGFKPGKDPLKVPHGTRNYDELRRYYKKVRKP